jgi:nucleoside-diphosphate-sugar epimerase
MTDKTILVLGANGRLGQAATETFAAAGWRVLAQARRAPNKLPPGAVHVGTSLVDTTGLARQASHASVVLHAVNPPYTQWATQAMPLLRAGMDVAQQLGALFMLPGNVYNFGHNMPALLTESTAQLPNTRKGRIRCEMELAMAARAENGLRSVVIRAGDFYGGGPGSWMDLVILKSIVNARLTYPGPLDAAHAWAYLPDLAKGFVAVAGSAPSSAKPGCEQLHFAGHTLSGAQLVAAVTQEAKSLGWVGEAGLKVGGLPWPLLRVGGLMWPQWRELAEMAYLWQVPHALDGTAMAARIGPLQNTPLEVAIRAALVAAVP